MARPNTEMLLKVADAIDLYPENYDQGEWIKKGGFDFGFRDAPFLSDEASIRNCGTKACIAGWAILLTPVESRQPSGYTCMSQVAQGILGLEYGEAKTIFDGSWEPEDGRSVPDELHRIAAQDFVEVAPEYLDDSDEEGEWEDNDSDL